MDNTDDYKPSAIEPKWQQIWADTKLYEVKASDQPKKYIIGMFPYPSGAGLHVGHVRNYSIVDVIARFHAQKGYNVLNTIGWDAFGLPAENYARKTGVMPRESTQQNIANFRNQLQRLGMSYDWSRELNTTDPEYYRWTQWIFTQLFKDDLAYQAENMQWWCEQCQTVLANEQVVAGKCWRHEGPDEPLISKKSTKQWFFKITDYAEELLAGIDDLKWPEGIKQQQRNWIGKSIGADVAFALHDSDQTIDVFTTRVDTLAGATFMVLAPEHPLVAELTTEDNQEAVTEYITEAQRKSDIERTDDSRDKTGVFTGAYAINPLTERQMPIWIADYVLLNYGHGAVMAVPAHDQRDNDFARNFNLPINVVIQAETGTPQKDPQYRRSIVAVLRNNDDEVLTINWGDKGGHLFVGGGVEEDEDIATAAKREIIEETGYTDIEFIGEGATAFHSYYAYSKQQERRIKATGLLFKLKSNERIEPDLEQDEQGNFSVEWHPIDEIHNLVTDELHLHVFDTAYSSKVYTGEGVMYCSGKYDGLSTSEAREQIVVDLAKDKHAKETTTYRMRDWLISRQRYWGAPIPVIHCSDCGPVVVPDEDLPVELPEVESLETEPGQTVLESVTDWVNVDCPECGSDAKRETDTLDGYACSSWYYLRYTDPHNSQAAWDKDKADYWMPIDYYCGGDHAVSHLLYSRFWSRFFADKGLISDDIAEPVGQLVFNGYIYANDGRKMSKSLGNVVDPLEVINDGYGADALRLYELFIAPYDQDTAWDDGGVAGSFRYLSRVWRLVNSVIDSDGDDEPLLEAELHKAVKAVSVELEHLRFNTAIAELMKGLNQFNKLHNSHPAASNWPSVMARYVSLLAPFAPHISEELWHRLGHDESVHRGGWPDWDAELVKEDIVTIVVQVNGKLRGEFRFDRGVSQEAVVEEASRDDKIAGYLDQGELVKTIFVADKLVNFVVK